MKSGALWPASRCRRWGWARPRRKRRWLRSRWGLQSPHWPCHLNLHGKEERKSRCKHWVSETTLSSYRSLLNLSLSTVLCTNCRGCYITNYWSQLRSPFTLKSLGYINVLNCHLINSAIHHETTSSKPIKLFILIANCPGSHWHWFYCGELHITKAQKLQPGRQVWTRGVND